jgi:glycerol-3-phosphate dehydrogenase
MRDLVVLGTPMAALRQWLELLRNCRMPVAWLCKGFEAARRRGCWQLWPDGA